MSLEWLYALFAPLGVVLFSMPAMILAANRLNLFDFPDPSTRGEQGRCQKLHRHPIPRIGGLAMVVSFLAGLVLTIESRALTTIYICSILLFLVGLADDIRPISVRFRIILQVLFVGTLIFGSNLEIRHISFFGNQLLLPEWLGGIFSIFIVVGAINSVNMMDGMDGLAAGICLISIVMLSYLHFLLTQQTWILSLLSISVIGAVVGFLKFNSHPARIFMGDGGSNWLGYIMGIMIILTLEGFNVSNGEITRAMKLPELSIVSVFLCVAIPALDTLFIILKRLKEKKHPFRPDQGHLHHILLSFGLEEKRVVLTIYFMAFFSATMGVLPIAYPEYGFEWIPYAYFLLLVSFMTLIKFGSSNTLRIVKRILTSKRQILWHHKSVNTVLRSWSTINRYCIYAIIFIGPFFCGIVPKDLATTAGIMLPIVGLTLFVPSRRDDFLQVLIITLAAAIILAAINSNALKFEVLSKAYKIQPFYNWIFIGLGISSLLYFFVTINRQHLKIGPTDFLLLTIPLVMLLIPEPWRSEYRLGVISARSLVLFAAMRTIAFGYSGVIRRLKLLVCIGLLYISLNGLLGFKFLY
ncbi:MAG: MraY family glycosyltransferase [Oligoflexus sp.]